MEKQKDEKKWTMPEDIVTTVTNKPEEMLNKYLVKPVKKTWTEDFRDECTGEKISVERSELLFEVATTSMKAYSRRLCSRFRRKRLKTWKCRRRSR